MFTGIIEKKGKIAALRPGTGSSVGGVRLTIDLEELAEGTKLGDSIAVNGACLTVSALAGTVASFDVVPETLRRTALGGLAPGQPVNLERALRVGDRLGGHFVQGHVDGTGTIARRTRAGGQFILHVSVPHDLTDQMIEKGSVAVDGISLTIAALTDGSFAVAVIPHTLERTTLGDKPDGALVNIEADMIGKYVRKLLGHGDTAQKLSEGFLREHGF